MLRLSKIGRIPIWLHRPLQGVPKTVTISREADGLYVCISCAEVPIEPLPRSGNETGIDVGLNVFRITADGAVVHNPRQYRTAEQQLVRAQRRVSRRTKGSKRRRKAVRLLARNHQQVKRQRRDFHHKTALALLRQYDVIYLEDLQVATMVRNHSLAKSISDAGWAGGQCFAPYSKAQQYTLAVELSRCLLPTPARTVVGHCLMGAAVRSG